MWNSEAPLKLLMSMPNYLSVENLKNIQEIIDVDKYENSKLFCRDLCGEYAPFCEICDKTVKYPCAVAYVKMKQAEGMEVEMEIAAADAEEPVAEEPIVEPVEEVEEAPKKYIRIAVARRKRG